MGATMFDKVWDAHVVGRRGDGRELIYVDRHVLHELHGPHAFTRLEEAGRTVRRPDLTFSVQDHTVSSRLGRDESTNPTGLEFIRAQRQGSKRFGITLFDIDAPEQGISHVVAPDLGMVMPGVTYACPDSHACTVGGIGALPLACGTSDLTHVLSTQVLAVKRPKTMRVRLDGKLSAGVTAKDAILHLIAVCGLDGARGHAVEYAGSAVRAMSIEARLTLCNMAIEMGARTGFVAPDDVTYDWIADRRWTPTGERWDQALSWWKTLPSDGDAVFDTDLAIDCSGLEPQITWGTDPSQVIGISGRTPATDSGDRASQTATRRALEYMDLDPGAPIEGLPIQRVFIGSCTNGRLPDLEAAAAVLQGRRVAEGVNALVVPGSTAVRKEAEERGLDRLFLEAGFIWGESGCSMCTGRNGDRGTRGERCVSTTNRNFEGRQGPGVRTHLASPAMAAAAALTGRITDVRKIMRAA